MHISECEVDRIKSSGLQVTVIVNKYTLCSQTCQPQENVAEAALKGQVQENAILHFVEYGMCMIVSRTNTLMSFK